MAEPTKEQLTADLETALNQIDALRIQSTQSEALITAQQQTLDETLKTLKALQASGAGWLIETLNPLYDGAPWGVPFSNGQAFMRSGSEYPQFAIQKLTGTRLRRYLEEAIPMLPGMDSVAIASERETERKSLAEREGLPSAEVGATRFRDQLGYVVEYFGPERALELQQRINSRLNLAKAAQSQEEARRQAEVMTTAPMLARGF